jgi:peptidylprolyl isomerase
VSGWYHHLKQSKERSSFLRKRSKRLLFSVFFLAAASEDPVIAERGTDRITISQARALIGATDHTTQHRLTTDPSALKAYLRDILLQRAILREAQAEKWDQRPDVSSLLQHAHDEVVAQTFLARQATLPAGYPGDAEIQAAYEANMSRFMQPRTYHLIQLFLPRTAYATAEEARKRLLPLRTPLERGKITLESAAKSVGAQYMDMGWASETQLVPAVKSAVAGLPEGEVTEPICIDNGCHLIRLVATKPAGPAPLADMRDELVRALRRQKQSEKEAAYESGLLAKTPVAVNEIQLSRITP